MGSYSIASGIYQSILQRQFREGLRLLDNNAEFMYSLTPDERGTARLFFALGCWAEYSPVAANAASSLLEQYRKPWPNSTLRDWGWVEAGKARLEFVRSNHEAVERAAAWVYDNASRFDPPPELLATVDLTMAQLFKHQLRYGNALEYAIRAFHRYEQSGFPLMAAVTKVTQGWLLTELGKHREAGRAWDLAAARLMDTDDCMNRGRICFYRARQFSRAEQQAKARDLYYAAAGHYFRAATPHRSVCGVLLSLADLEYRMTLNCPEQAKDLRKTAASHITMVECLLAEHPEDVRNQGRLLLSKINQALFGEPRCLERARRLAKEARDYGVRHNDEQIAAWARLRQSKVESEAGEMEEDGSAARCLALRFALEARDSAVSLQNDRLAARCHHHLGNLYLRKPFCDTASARREYLEAVKCMEQHPECDYLAKSIRHLKAQIDSAPWKPGDSVIAVVTGQAFQQPLELTVQTVEEAIVLAALRFCGDSVRAMRRLLGAGGLRIEKHLAKKRAPQQVAPACDADRVIILEVRTSFAFTRDLEETINSVERAVVESALQRHRGDQRAVCETLHIGWNRLQRSLQPPANDLDATRSAA